MFCCIFYLLPTETTLTNKTKAKPQEENTNGLLFADDQTITAQDEAERGHHPESLNKESELNNLKINTYKT